ncbi:hypothetical protein D9757_012560 [Collybiopsis confluens]|uniref:DUF6534 domain-containing protein n=1 Tax=Collybiopsis confluens TaxID=2823264 RepID=A0A8H5G1B9_9AGAR|nr:hypothetical protein D9757_012560 [Collybiopsis confluens]
MALGINIPSAAEPHLSPVMASDSLIAVADSTKNLLWGPYFGMLFSTVLVGTVGAQTWTYLHRNNDSAMLRATVIYLFIATVSSNCLDIATTFNYTIAHFGDAAAIDLIPRFVPHPSSIDLSIRPSTLRYFILELIISGIPVVIVDIFFASRIHHGEIRIYRFNDHRSMTDSHPLFPSEPNLLFPILYNRYHRPGRFLYFFPVISYPAVPDFAITKPSLWMRVSVTAGFLFNVPTRANLDSSWVKSPIFAQNLLRAFTALISSGAMYWAFRKSHVTTKRTKSILDKILQFTVTRGILLVVAQTVAALMFEFSPQNLRWMAFHMMLDKIYVITMLTMLNSRTELRKTLSALVTDSDFIRRSMSARRKTKNIIVVAQDPVGSTRNETNDQTNDKASVQLQLDPDVDLEGLQVHSGTKVAGIMVFQESISEVDYGGKVNKILFNNDDGPS